MARVFREKYLRGDRERIPEISEGPLSIQQGPDQHRHMGKLPKAGDRTTQKD